MGTMRDPKWWSEKHGTAWERVKEALRRDWEQTKADVSSKGQELDQDVGDTLKQAAGKEYIPPAGVPNPPDVKEIAKRNDRDWIEVEDSYRYGVGAHEEYPNDKWDDNLESKLSREWGDLKTGKTWDETKDAVKRGWDRVRH